MNVERAMNSYGVEAGWQKRDGFLWTLLAIMLLGFESKPVYGQVEAGTVSGTVKDSTGAVVAGAQLQRRIWQLGPSEARRRRQWSVQITGLNPGRMK